MKLNDKRTSIACCVDMFVTNHDAALYFQAGSG